MKIRNSQRIVKNRLHRLSDVKTHQLNYFLYRKHLDV